MPKLLKITWITIFITFLFSGCTIPSMRGNILALHPDTIQNVKKDINFEVSNVKLSKDLPTYTVQGFIIEEHSIKNSLQENLNKFYPQNSKITPYIIELSMDFEKKGFVLEIDIQTNATYKIFKDNNLIKTINIKSKYSRKQDNKTPDNQEYLEAALNGVDDDLYNIPEFREKYLEYTAYVFNKEIASEQEHFTHLALRHSYSGAIRLNFAKFIKELNKLELK
ncbi:hypothetical protein [Aliarcobacter cryaerophilus]|uniref:hypothetical protein n=1 Tax=Aliarcobacter cryaerophilus TaxID=28198 RepID=UPI003BAFB5E2